MDSRGRVTGQGNGRGSSGGNGQRGSSSGGGGRGGGRSVSSDMAQSSDMSPDVLLGAQGREQRRAERARSRAQPMPAELSEMLKETDDLPITEYAEQQYGYQTGPSSSIDPVLRAIDDAFAHSQDVSADRASSRSRQSARPTPSAEDIGPLPGTSEERGRRSTRDVERNVTEWQDNAQAPFTLLNLGSRSRQGSPSQRAGSTDSRASSHYGGHAGTPFERSRSPSMRSYEMVREESGVVSREQPPSRDPGIESDVGDSSTSVRHRSNTPVGETSGQLNLLYFNMIQNHIDRGMEPQSGVFELRSHKERRLYYRPSGKPSDEPQQRLYARNSIYLHRLHQLISKNLVESGGEYYKDLEGQYWYYLQEPPGELSRVVLLSSSEAVSLAREGSPEGKPIEEQNLAYVQRIQHQIDLGEQKWGGFWRPDNDGRLHYHDSSSQSNQKPQSVDERNMTYIRVVLDLAERQSLPTRNSRFVEDETGKVWYWQREDAAAQDRRESTKQEGKQPELSRHITNAKYVRDVRQAVAKRTITAGVWFVFNDHGYLDYKHDPNSKLTQEQLDRLVAEAQNLSQSPGLEAIAERNVRLLRECDPKVSNKERTTDSWFSVDNNWLLIYNEKRTEQTLSERNAEYVDHVRGDVEARNVPEAGWFVPEHPKGNLVYRTPKGIGKTATEWKKTPLSAEHLDPETDWDKVIKENILHLNMISRQIKAGTHKAGGHYTTNAQWQLKYVTNESVNERNARHVDIARQNAQAGLLQADGWFSMDEKGYLMYTTDEKTRAAIQRLRRTRKQRAVNPEVDWSDAEELRRVKYEIVDPYTDSGRTFKVNVKYLDLIFDKLAHGDLPKGGWFPRDVHWQLEYRTAEGDKKKKETESKARDERRIKKLNDAYEKWVPKISPEQKLKDQRMLEGESPQRSSSSSSTKSAIYNPLPAQSTGPSPAAPPVASASGQQPQGGGPVRGSGRGGGRGSGRGSGRGQGRGH